MELTCRCQLTDVVLETALACHPGIEPGWQANLTLAREGG